MKIILSALVALLALVSIAPSASARSCQQQGGMTCCATSSGYESCHTNPVQ
jgi:hypothetical protein